MNVQVYRESDRLVQRVDEMVREASKLIPFARVTYEVMVGMMLFPPAEEGGRPIEALGAWVGIIHPHPLLSMEPIVQWLRIPYGRALNDEILAGYINGMVRRMWDLVEAARVQAGLG